MINTKDQEHLFKLIADYLDKDITCIAIGGTAMMFAGYKTATKDIDLVFASEQGSAFPFAKWTCYNAGLGSALIVKWPGVVAAGSVSDAIVEYSDFVPTFIDLAGGAPASGLDGKSIVPVLKGETQKHKKYSYGIMTLRGVHNASVYYPIRSINDGTYRLILNLAPEIEYRNQARMPGWKATAKTNAEAAKLIQRHKFRPALELYNDVTDPWNVTNLAEDPKHAELIKELRGELEKWMEYAGDDSICPRGSGIFHLELQQQMFQHQESQVFSSEQSSFLDCSDYNTDLSFVQIFIAFHIKGVLVLTIAQLQISSFLAIAQAAFFLPAFL